MLAKRNKLAKSTILRLVIKASPTRRVSAAGVAEVLGAEVIGRRRPK